MDQCHAVGLPSALAPELANTRKQVGLKCFKVLLTVYMSTLTYWSFYFFICFVRLFMRCESVMRSVVTIPRF